MQRTIMRRNYVRRILCLPSRVAHSLVWILPDCHGIVALLVISGKQPSSELLHTLRFTCVCWPPKRQCSISTTSSPQHGSTSCLPGNFLACVTVSTNVNDTASSHRARVSHNILSRLDVCESRPAATALSAVVECCGEHTHLLRAELLLSESAFC